MLPPASALASALAKCLSFYVKVFYVMGKALSGELSCPCDRSCYNSTFLCNVILNCTDGFIVLSMYSL